MQLKKLIYFRYGEKTEHWISNFQRHTEFISSFSLAHTNGITILIFILPVIVSLKLIQDINKVQFLYDMYPNRLNELLRINRS